MGYKYISDCEIERNYVAAKEIFAGFGVDADKALAALRDVKVSAHCWQGDDVAGFEVKQQSLSGGIMATGTHPGKARNPAELRQDLDKALSLVPGKHKVNVHAIYLETDGKRVERDEIGVEHFANWLSWAKERGVGLDFNPSFFSHANSADGFTLSHPNADIRRFWIEHGRRCREIGAAFAAELKEPCVINFWIPDGYKDTPADRWAPRKRLLESLDTVFRDDLGTGLKDAVEGKLFGIGSEEYVVGSNEFYLAYAVARKKLPCLDMGHYHPTESVADKISAVLAFVPELLLHVSRGVRWDSDHVVTLNDELRKLGQEVVRGDALGRVYLATDFFDASINRIGAWVIGLRNTLKSVLYALLEPNARYRELENAGRFAERLALMEEAKDLPMGRIWDYHCLKSGVPAGAAWLDDMLAYEQGVQDKRR